MVLKTPIIAVILLAAFAVGARTRKDKIKELLDALKQGKSEKNTQIAAQDNEAKAKKSVVEDEIDQAVEVGATGAPGDAQADSAGALMTSLESLAVLVQEGVAHGGQERSSDTGTYDSEIGDIAPAAELPPEAEEFAVWLAALLHEVFPSDLEAAEAGKRVAEAMANNDIPTEDTAGFLKALCDRLGSDPEVALKCKERFEGKSSATAAEEASTPTQVALQKEQAASSAMHASTAFRSLEYERRAALNGRYFTKSEFMNHYGDALGAERWDEANTEKENQDSKLASFANGARAALRSLEYERRAALNGRYFTRAEFMNHYGDSLGAERWDDAKEEKENQHSKLASFAKGARAALRSLEYERRAAPNGRYFTKAEFLDHYGDAWGAEKWDEAKEEKENQDSKLASFANGARAALRSLETERRASLNGRYFTKAEFIHHYGDAWGAEKWDEAKAEKENQYPKVAAFNNAARAAVQSLSAYVTRLSGYP